MVDEGIVETTPDPRAHAGGRGIDLDPTASFLRRLPPVDGHDLTADDSDGAAGVRGVFPNLVIPLAEPWKDRSEDRLAINSAFQDLDMDACRAAPWADLDFPTVLLRLRIDDQGANILPNIEHNTFGMNPVGISLNHCLISSFR
jgi:hypothetical protein